MKNGDKIRGDEQNPAPSTTSKPGKDTGRNPKKDFGTVPDVESLERLTEEEGPKDD